MYYKVSKGLFNCPDAKLLRETIFVKEQQFNNEFDELDEKCVHVIAYKNNEPVATVRYYIDDNEIYHIGRVAVNKDFRGQHIGDKIMLFCEQRISDIGGKTIDISAQERVKGFYQQLGYKEYGDRYLDEHVPHIRMKKELGKA